MAYPGQINEYIQLSHLRCPLALIQQFDSTPHLSCKLPKTGLDWSTAVRENIHRSTCYILSALFR